jgi:hypothetical protein
VAGPLSRRQNAGAVLFDEVPQRDDDLEQQEEY